MLLINPLRTELSVERTSVDERYCAHFAKKSKHLSNVYDIKLKTLYGKNNVYK